jgi:hypothetical protein
MAGRMYTAVIDATSVAAVCEIFFIGAPTDAVVVIHQIVITQDTSETSEQLPLNVFRTATNQSAKGTANTPAPLNVGDAAFGGVVRTNILTAETLATETTMLFRQSQNQLNGWNLLFTPETRPILSPTAGSAAYMCIKLDAAPSASIPISGYILFEEIGG